MTVEQRAICAKFDAEFVETKDTGFVGLSNDTNHASAPIHGLRHPPTEAASGWYIWRGEYSDKDDFFRTVHVAHLGEECPQVLKFLGLAPGWRFLIAGDQVDVWYDEKLLAV